MKKHPPFCWFDPGILHDNDMELALSEKVPANPNLGYVPSYMFQMKNRNTSAIMGNVDLRVGDTYDLRMYGGHIAYGVLEPYRGHHYAARASKLILPLARKHGMKEIWITCNPDNYASRRTCEIMGAQLIEIVQLPEHIDMYKEGERSKCRFLIEL